MAYTEIKEIKNKKYYYRVISLRNDKKVSKKRIYLGVNLPQRKLAEKMLEADKKFLRDKVDKNLAKIKLKIIKVLKKYRVKRAGIFGSYVRGEERKNSDLDILIEPSTGMGFEFAGVEIQLAKTLKRKVDLVSYNGISPHLKDKILSQEVRIL